MQLKLQKTIALTAIFIGLLLLVFMITTEDEPGAIPPGFVFGGSVWYLIVRRKLKKSKTASA